MNTNALRQKILDLAIRGKLVPQNPNDEPASVLLERIRAQKQQMVKEGKLKAKDIAGDSIIYLGDDNLHYEKFADGSVKCIEEEIPFEVPEGWAWSRLKTISNIGTGATPLKSNAAYYQKGTIPWVTSAATSSSIITNATDFISELALQETNCRVYPIGTLIIAMYGEGKTRGQISELGIEACTNQACAAICVLYEDENFKNYIKRYLLYSYTNLRDKAQGGQQPNLNQSIIADMIIPIPPLNEIEHIVACSSLCLEYVDRINANKEAVKQYVDLIRKQILDLAIRGKLVPQDPTDESASVLLERIRTEKETLIKQGKIKRDKKESIIFRGDDNSYYEKVDGETVCIDDEIPFELPNGWEWCRLETCCAKEIKRGKSPRYAESGDILVFAQKCNSKYAGIDLSLSLYLDETTIGKYTDDEYLQDKDIIVNSTGTGTLGRVGIYRESDNASHAKIVPDSHVTVIRAVCSLEPRFLFAVLKANQGTLEELGEGSTNQKELKPVSLKTLLVPIPPFAEQERIVNTFAKIATQIDSIAALIN